MYLFACLFLFYDLILYLFQSLSNSFPLTIHKSNQTTLGTPKCVKFVKWIILQLLTGMFLNISTCCMSHPSVSISYPDSQDENNSPSLTTYVVLQLISARAGWILSQDGLSQPAGQSLPGMTWVSGLRAAFPLPCRRKTTVWESMWGIWPKSQIKTSNTQKWFLTLDFQFVLSKMSTVTWDWSSMTTSSPYSKHWLWASNTRYSCWL